MRIRTFTAATMSEAMAQVRDALGPDAIIVSTFEGKRGRGVEVRAAVDHPPPNPAPAMGAEDTLEARLRTRLNGEMAQDLDMLRGMTKPAPAHPRRQPTQNMQERAQAIARALVYHRVPSDLGKALVALMRRSDANDPDTALRLALDAQFRFESIAPQPDRPILLIGPPGAGKTSTAAKLGARTVLAGGKVTLVTTDTVKAGAGAQMEIFASLLDQPWTAADDPDDLETYLQTANDHSVIIDTPGTNPFNKAEMRDLARFCRSARVEPVLVLPSGGDLGDLADTARAFHTLGARRMITTRLDAARRHGGLLWAADQAGLAFAQTSMTPYLANGLTDLGAALLGDLLLDVPPTPETTKPPDAEKAPAPQAVRRPSFQAADAAVTARQEVSLS